MKERKIEYEILKAILIISIVVGHTLATSLINVFWYHVQGFFMLTGYFSKSSILDGKYLNINSVLINRLRRYVLPYFSYSIVLYILFQQEPVIKNLVRVLLGGGWNVGLYSYPFWFINALFVTTIAFDLILCAFRKVQNCWKKVMVASLFTVVWMFIHCSTVYPFLVYLPWSIDQSLGAIVFVYVGFMMKGVTLKWWHCIFPFFAIGFILLHYFHPEIDCHLNMCPMTYRNIVIDIIIPLVFVITFYILSLGLSRIPWISAVLGYVGSASFTIFFIHAAVIAVWPWSMTWWTVLSAVCGGTLLHLILNKFNITRILFIGK